MMTIHKRGGNSSNNRIAFHQSVPDLLEGVGDSHGHSGCEVNIGHEGDIVALLPQRLSDFHARISLETALHGETSEISTLLSDLDDLYSGT
jgi:hypothetical protein